MYMITFAYTLSMLLSLTMAALAYIISKKTLKDREKASPFECGFDPSKKARSPFSLRFFIITIIFLIFDVEVSLLLPLALAPSILDPLPLTSALFILTIILIWGLIHEWMQGALNWAM